MDSVEAVLIDQGRSRSVVGRLGERMDPQVGLSLQVEGATHMMVSTDCQVSTGSQRMNDLRLADAQAVRRGVCYDMIGVFRTVEPLAWRSMAHAEKDRHFLCDRKVEDGLEFAVV